MHRSLEHTFTAIPQRNLGGFPLARLQRFPIAALILTIGAIAAWVIPSISISLQYDRTALDAGEWWRLLTCHWTHFSQSHFLWDTGAFALLGALCELRDRGRFLMCAIVSAATIPAVLWIFVPEIQTFRGLSGIDSALFTLLAVEMLRSEAAPGGRIGLAGGVAFVLLLFVVKMAVEIISGKTVFVDSAGITPLPLSHFVGAVAGILFAHWNSGARPASGAEKTLPFTHDGLVERRDAETQRRKERGTSETQRFVQE